LDSELANGAMGQAFIPTRIGRPIEEQVNWLLNGGHRVHRTGVSLQLLHFLTKIPNACFQTAKLDEATIKCLNDLQVTDLAHDMERIEDSKDTLLKDCYEWILQDPILQEWWDGDTN
jgi:hypothetical protein